MRYILGKGDWQTAAQGESRCFLLTNGLGGFCSQTVIGSNARNDHALLISANVAPSERWIMIHRMDEVLYVDGKAYDLSSQSYVNRTQNTEGYRYLNQFELDGLPKWEFMADGVRVIKRLVLPYGTNSLAVSYEVSACPGQHAHLEVTPVYGIHQKYDRPAVWYPVHCEMMAEMDGYCLKANGESLYLKTDAAKMQDSDADGKGIFVADYYYEQDAADGREGFGSGMKLHRLCSEETADSNQWESSLTVIYGTEPEWMRKVCAKKLSHVMDELCEAELARQTELVRKSGLISPAGQQLALSADAYLTERESTNGMSIMAGFPFFGDWGRDTMIAFYGCTVALDNQEAARSILRTFMQYCRRGIMPNLFPEGNQEPMYNTVDASLLFINAAWEYLNHYEDPELESEILTAAEKIVSWYANGTDYNIHMADDGLLVAGNDLWQLTWMDVRFGDILPTPRHGKPVEINAYWYNAVRVLEELMRRNGAQEAVRVDEAEQEAVCADVAEQEAVCADEAEQEAVRADEAEREEVQTDAAETEAVPALTAGWKEMDCAQKADWLAGLAEKIRSSFLTKFSRPDQTLYDVLPEHEETASKEAKLAKEQVRCNQVFALTVAFPVVEQEQALAILAQIRQKLYTPVGLRSLSPDDPQYHPNYGGSQFCRDMAYHQGTVWGYPLGDYYRACLRFALDKKKEAERIRWQLGGIEAAMEEGCLGHLAEIYEGEMPAASKGCFAQAWSVAQVLRVYQEIEEVLR